MPRLQASDSLDPSNLSQTEHLDIVTRRHKTVVRSSVEVPEENITPVPIKNTTIRPKTTNPDHVNSPWLHDFESAYMLHLPNAYVGDNVIFDQDYYYGFDKWWLGSRWQLYSETKHVQIEQDWVISIAAWGGEAFQHFILDVLPKLGSVIELLESPEYQHVKIASHRDHVPIGQWLWRKLGLEDRFIQKPINAKQGLVISTPMALFPSFSPSHEDFAIYPRGCLLPVQKRLGVLEEVNQNLVVYLPRQGQRRVDNQAEILIKLSRRLQNTGYSLHVFNPSGDFDQDSSIMRRAKVIVGPHGGAFANIAFAKPGTHIIEFLPVYDIIHDPVNSGRHYWGLAQAVSQDYWAVTPDEFCFDGPMVVDFNQLNQILDQVL